MKAIFSQIGFLTFLSFSSASKSTDETNFLRGKDIAKNRKPARNISTTADRKLNPTFCGCAGCDQAAFNVIADEHSCGDRISYLQQSMGFSERDACAKVGGADFPGVCGICDPNSCNQKPPPSPPGKCGCPECEDAWNVSAGGPSCGARIEWLQAYMSFDERGACSRVGSEEFPNECGKCDPSRCNLKPPPSPPGKCGCPECEDAWNVSAGGPSCGARIEWLQAYMSFDERGACSRVGSEEFPNECGKCDPSRCNLKPPTPAPVRAPTPAPVNNSNDMCGCSTCGDSVLNTFAGDHTCGDRIKYVRDSLQWNERDACSRVAGLEFPTECGGCDPDRCVSNDDDDGHDDDDDDGDDDNNINTSQKCGGAVDSSGDSNQVCQRDLWDPTGDSTMHCFAYGGSGDPCHLNNNNEPDHGRFKNPSTCFGDTFYLWDEPDTQGKSYTWAGQTWLEYSQRFPNELKDLKARGTKITSPLLKAGGPGVLTGNLRDFFTSCGPPCADKSDPAYVDIIAINAFCGDFNGPSGCRGGAGFIYNEALAASGAFGNLPVYVTNWSRLQTSNPQDQVDAINAIEEFFPNTGPSNPVIERVYWFGATDFGGGSSNNFLTQVLADGSTLGELWRQKCDSLH